MLNSIKNTISAGGIVMNRDGKILVVNQHGTSWSLPKGHVEGSESMSEAAQREIYEESGIRQLEFIRELGDYYRYKITDDGTGEDQSELKHIFMILFKTTENILKPIDPENPEARWVDKNEVADLLTHPKDRDFFLSIKDLIQ